MDAIWARIRSGAPEEDSILFPSGVSKGRHESHYTGSMVGMEVENTRDAAAGERGPRTYEEVRSVSGCNVYDI